jgi:hypothetical protein
VTCGSGCDAPGATGLHPALPANEIQGVPFLKEKPRRSGAPTPRGLPADQWPKNSQSRMITGIGTPNNQSKIPRPIIFSSSPDL